MGFRVLVLVVLLSLSLFLQAQGPFESGLAPAEFPDQKNPSVAEAIRLSREGQYFASIRTLERQEAQHPNLSEVQTALALNYLLLDQRLLFKEAIAKALSLDSRSAQAYYLTGRFALEAEQDPAKAVESFQKTLEIDSTSFKAHYYLGVCFRSLNQFEKACESFRRAAQNSLYDWPFRALAEVELGLGRPDLSLIAALAGIEKNASSAENCVAAGKAYQALGKLSLAAEMFQKAADLDTTWEQPHYYLARLYGQQPEHRAKAKEHFRLFEELRQGRFPLRRKGQP